MLFPKNQQALFNNPERLNDYINLLLTTHFVIPHPGLRKDPNVVLQEFLDKYPSLERWRLFVDGCKYATPVGKLAALSSKEIFHETIANRLMTTLSFGPESDGWLSYQMREPGSLEACLHALHYALLQINQPRNDLKLMHAINQRVTDKVANLSLKHPSKLTGGKHYNAFVLSKKGFYSVTGMKDLFDKIANQDLPGAYIEATDATRFLYHYSFKDRDKLTIYRNIIDYIVRNNQSICHYDAKILSEIKTKCPTWYDAFITDLSEVLCSKSCPFYGTYYAVATKFSERIPRLLHCKSIFKDGGYPRDILSAVRHIIPENALVAKKSIEETIDFLPLVWVQKLNCEINNKLFNSEVKPIDENLIRILHREIMSGLEKGDNKFIKLMTERANELNPKNFITLNEAIIKAANEQWAHQLLNWVIIHRSCELIKTYLQKQIEKVWQDYYQACAQSNLSDDELLLVIGKTIQSLERIHPLVNANGRTFVNILLNILLMEHGFPPATFYQPNIFDAFDELVEALKSSIANTLKIYAATDLGEETNLFGVKTSEIEANLKGMLIKYPRPESSILMNEIVAKANQRITGDPEMVGTQNFSTSKTMSFFKPCAEQSQRRFSFTELNNRTGDTYSQHRFISSF